MSNSQLIQEGIAASPKVVAAGTLAAFAQGLDPWIKILGFVYIVMQIAFLVWKAWRVRKDKKDSE